MNHSSLALQARDVSNKRFVNNLWLIGVTIFFSGLSISLGSLYASITIHNHLLKNVMHLPLTFFDITPVGRILNRFSNDLFDVDVIIPRLNLSFVRMLFMVNDLFTIFWLGETLNKTVDLFDLLLLACLVGFALLVLFWFAAFYRF